MPGEEIMEPGQLGDVSLGVPGDPEPLPDDDADNDIDADSDEGDVTDNDPEEIDDEVEEI